MLKISRLADYALLILQELAKPMSSNHCSANTLASQTRLALPTVSKILKTLAEAGIVTSIRGTQGGYRLAVLPQQINLAEIITAMDGEIALTECCKSQHFCEQHLVCHLSEGWRAINQIIVKLLQNLSLTDLQQRWDPSQIVISIQNDDLTKNFLTTKGHDHAQ